ncbi:endonuclease MutS2 [Bacillota bacterium HCP3S3_F1_1]
MNEKVMRICEFNKITALLAEHATSDPGRALCRALSPLEDLCDIIKAQEETESALGYLFRNGSISFGNNRDFSAAFQALHIGTTLSLPELLQLAAFLENVARVRSAGPGDEADPLFDLFDCLVPLSPVSSEIRRCILAEDRIADDASPELKRIRREIGLTDDRIHAQLGKMLNQTYSSYLQDNVITVRDDRYCLPIKSEYKSQVRGIVHDQSSTGSTLFIEPAAIVEMGNAIRELQIKERKEEEKILASLSVLLSDHLTALRDNCANMTQLDFIFAKAGLALDENAVRPDFNEEHIIRIHKGRHPLIDPKKVVPIDLTIGEDYDMIIVTGPNTGGKTVTLKTVGLFELMGMAGLHIPAGEHSELSLFREVYADIGDEQSIEQSLSTFSSHMTSIVDILKRADKNCLCLFDELGSGTDPTEGAALAISILNFMHTRKISTLATTHYAELKLYAMRTEGIVNASCEFDVETLQPTYRLLVGIPGKSNAFAISQKLGLPGYIIETAKEQMSQETRNFEDVLTDLEDTRRRNAKQQEQLDKMKADLERRSRELKQKEDSLEERRRKILDQANEKARNILQDAKDQADSAISAIRKNSKGADMSAMEQTRTSLREKVSAKNRRLQKPEEKKPRTSQLSPSDLHIGDRVKVLSLGMQGTVTKLPDRQNKVGVQCGIMNSQIPLKDLALIDEETGMTIDSQAKKKASSALKRAYESRSYAAETSGIDLSRAMNISPEINLLGMTTDEALMALDKYLDDARMSHLDTVRVVHGKGTGALRNAVQNYLRKQSFVRSYRGGDFGEGDAGVTIVNL